MIAQHGAESGFPDSRRLCANWGGQAECWVGGFLHPEPASAGGTFQAFVIRRGREPNKGICFLTVGDVFSGLSPLYPTTHVS